MVYPSNATHKVIVIERVVTIRNYNVDAAQYTEHELQIVGVDEPGEPAFVGTLLDCEQWQEEEEDSFKTF